MLNEVKKERTLGDQLKKNEIMKVEIYVKAVTY